MINLCTLRSIGSSFMIQDSRILISHTVWFETDREYSFGFWICPCGSF